MPLAVIFIHVQTHFSAIIVHGFPLPQPKRKATIESENFPQKNNLLFSRVRTQKDENRGKWSVCSMFLDVQTHLSPKLHLLRSSSSHKRQHFVNSQFFDKNNFDSLRGISTLSGRNWQTKAFCNHLKLCRLNFLQYYPLVFSHQSRNRELPVFKKAIHCRQYLIWCLIVYPEWCEKPYCNK